MTKRRTFEVEWADAARTDLALIVDYIAADSVDSAILVLEKIESRAASLTIMPQRGRVVPELAVVGVHSYREIMCAPWRIVYRIAGRKVYVLAVLDSRRNLEDLLLDRLLR
jgi:plasmid stabilization system protein ParE